MFILCLIVFKKSEPTVVFVILIVFLLFMLQLVLAVMLQFWLPSIWAIISFTITAFVLMARTRFSLFNNRAVSRESKLDAIKQKIEEENYEAAVLMLKNCEFFHRSALGYLHKHRRPDMSKDHNAVAYQFHLPQPDQIFYEAMQEAFDSPPLLPYPIFSFFFLPS